MSFDIKSTLSRVMAVVATVVLMSACAKGRKMDMPTIDAFAGVQTISLRDETSNLVRDNTDAAMIPAMVASALKDKGYDVCSLDAECKWDAIGKVVVTQMTKKHLAFTFQLVDAGSNQIYLYKFNHGRLRGFTVEEYALMAVQYATHNIPPRRQGAASSK